MGSAAAVAESVFVGREREMLELRSALDAALAGRGSLTMLIGEPGIGKTRTADQLASLAAESGTRVFWGRCWEGEGAPAYWPWIQIIRSMVAGVSPEEASRAMGPGAADVAKIAPDAAAKANVRPSRGSVGTDQGRFRLFDSVVSLLKNTAGKSPLMLILDDLHWADKSSLLLLHFLSRELRTLPVLVVGTYRDVEVGPDHPHLETLGRLARESRRIRLSGLTETDVARFIAAAYGIDPTPRLVSAVCHDTQGNPFFVDEVVRLLWAEHRLDTANPDLSWEPVIPQGVKEVIGRRLGQLSGQCAELLRTAAVMGRQFDLGVIGAVNPAARTGEAIQEAMDARIVEEVQDSPGRFDFTHVLIREALYGELAAAKKRRLHGEIGRVLEDRWEHDPDFYLSQLSYHFFQAGADLEKAMDYAIKGAERATLRVAHEEAAALYARALTVLDKTGGDAARRCDLLLMLGDAQSRAAEIQQARLTFEQAANEARRINDPGRLAQAALGFGGRFVRLESGVLDKALVELLEEVLKALGNRRSPLVATVLARLSRALFYSDDQANRVVLAEKALRMATRLGDPAARLAALHSKFWTLMGPQKSKQRLATAEKIVELALQSDDREMALQGHLWSLMERAELGDMEGALDEMTTFWDLSQQLRQPLYLWFSQLVRANHLLMQGLFEKGEMMAREALITGERAEISLARRAFEQQMFWVWREQERLSELTLMGSKEALQISTTLTAQVALRAFRAFFLNAQGKTDAARTEFSKISSDQLTEIPWDLSWLSVVAAVSEVCLEVDDRSHAGTLYELLAPYSGRFIRFGPSVDYYLGRLAALLGNREDAEDRLNAAIRASTNVGAIPWLARAQFECALVLLDGTNEERARATHLLAEAAETGHALGMTRLLEQIGKSRNAVEQGPVARCEPHPSAIAEPPQATAQSPQHSFKDWPDEMDNAFRQEGDYWTIVYQGQLVRLKDSKGLHYIAMLLREPGREFHVVDLAGSVQGPTVSEGPSMKPSVIEAERLSVSRIGDAGELLDQTARKQYQRRLGDLNEEMQEARETADSVRLARAQEEIDALTEQLTAAYGLGGRSRRASDVSDRIRKAVTNRIQSSLGKIREQAPGLGAHLSNAIRTGAFCSYVPEQRIIWRF